MISLRLWDIKLICKNQFYFYIHILAMNKPKMKLTKGDFKIASKNKILGNKFNKRSIKLIL